MVAGPTHQSMVLFDVEGSGRRTDPEKTEVRQALYRLLMVALARTGLCWDDCRAEDRGDGVYLLVPPTAPKPLLATALVGAVDRLLGQAPGGGRRRLRLRMALHAGEVTIDDHGSSGTDVDTAFALLDAGVVRTALRTATRARLVVVLSDPFFRATVPHRYPGLDPKAYRQVTVGTKQGPVPAWLSRPGHPSHHPP